MLGCLLWVLTAHFPEREKEKKKDKRKNVQTAPTYCKHNKPLPHHFLNSKLVGRTYTESLPSTIAPLDQVDQRGQLSWQRTENQSMMGTRAVDKREYLVIIRDNFCQFCTKTYVVTPHLNHLDKTVQMRRHTYGFSEKQDLSQGQDSSPDSALQSHKKL